MLRTVTITLRENPPGLGDDLTIVVSGEPDVVLGPDGMIDADQLTPAVAAAAHMLSSLVGEVAAIRLFTMNPGAGGGNN